MCPAAMHPYNVPEEYKNMYTSYKETWKDAPMQDGESMIVFYSKMNTVELVGNVQLLIASARSQRWCEAKGKSLSLSMPSSRSP